MLLASHRHLLWQRAPWLESHPKGRWRRTGHLHGKDKWEQASFVDHALGSFWVAALQRCCSIFIVVLCIVVVGFGCNLVIRYVILDITPTTVLHRCIPQRLLHTICSLQCQKHYRSRVTLSQMFREWSSGVKNIILLDVIQYLSFLFTFVKHNVQQHS